MLSDIWPTGWHATELAGVKPGETVVVAAAAGGVGVIAAQLALLAGARVIGTASDANAAFLRSLGVEPVRYGDGLLERIRSLAPDGVDAYLDNFGAGNVDLAVQLGVARSDQHHQRRRRRGPVRRPHRRPGAGQLARRMPGACRPVVAGKLTVPIQAVSPLERVRDAYDELAARHTQGKIVLRLTPN